MDIEIADIATRLLDKFQPVDNQCFRQEAFTRQEVAYFINYNNITTLGIQLRKQRLKMVM